MTIYRVQRKVEMIETIYIDAESKMEARQWAESENLWIDCEETFDQIVQTEVDDMTEEEELNGKD